MVGGTGLGTRVVGVEVAVLVVEEVCGGAALEIDEVGAEEGDGAALGAREVASEEEGPKLLALGDVCTDDENATVGTSEEEEALGVGDDGIDAVVATGTVAAMAGINGLIDLGRATGGRGSVGGAGAGTGVAS